MTRHIGIVLFDGVEELDAVGPWEVFAAWCRFFPDDGYAVSMLAPTGGQVECNKGLTILAHHSFDDAPSYDVLLHPGGQGTRPLMKDVAHLEWVRQQRSEVSLLTSVCTGSLVYAAAGLLAGRPATTHWGSLELLKETDPSIMIRPDDRYVDDGDVITSAGVSAGIDMALHVVRRLVGDERAREVRRYIQYDPEPPV
ncbi:MAG: DJ-1/PfpI family protein [Frankiaceae bacterium]|nr:DJ-1/PfpI family protein [Frankiaceae bacterium]MBV9869205.1 DJ-1/PfpI family protein [Frankiaceae bacterium]